MRAYSLCIIIFSMMLTAPSFASEKEDVKKGNILYNKGDYSGAAKLYEKAAMEKSGSGIPELNRGAALYKDGAYNKAIQSFNRSIASGRADLIRAADYNIGNSTYRIGASKDSADKEKKNIKKTAEVYWAALQYYKRAIDLDPSDKDAKFNYEFVAKKMEELSPLFQIKQEEEKKKEQDNKNKKDNQDKEDQDNQDQKQDQQKDQQDQQEKDKPEQGQGGEGQPQGEKESQSEDQEKDKDDSGGESEQKEKKPQGGEEEDKSKPDREKDKEDQGRAGEDKESRAKDQEEEKQAQVEEQAEGADEGKEEAQAQEERGAEESGKPEEKQDGLVAYQGAQKDPAEGTEMTEQEAKMLLEGYKGEEATGRMVKMRRKSADMAEPAKDW